MDFLILKGEIMKEQIEQIKTLAKEEIASACDLTSLDATRVNT